MVGPAHHLRDKPDLRFGACVVNRRENRTLAPQRSSRSNRTILTDLPRPLQIGETERALRASVEPGSACRAEGARKVETSRGDSQRRKSCRVKEPKLSVQVLLGVCVARRLDLECRVLDVEVL